MHCETVSRTPRDLGPAASAEHTGTSSERTLPQARHVVKAMSAVELHRSRLVIHRPRARGLGRG